MPYMHYFNKPTELAVEEHVGETKEERRKRIRKEINRSYRKIKINKILAWIRWRTIYVPRRIRIRIWALKRWDKNGPLSLAEVEDLYYLKQPIDKQMKRLRKELKNKGIIK